MLRVANNLWIGGSDDWYNAEVVGATAVLNVAQDLKGKCGWPNIEYTQVGLIDGPGNELGDYCTAILCLRMLFRRHEVVLVYDHNGPRALTVTMMYTNLIEGQHRSSPTQWGYWPSFKQRIKIVKDNVGINLPEIHEAHAKAFDQIPWGLLATFV